MSWFWFLVAAAGWFTFWLETVAHAESRRHAQAEYAALRQRFGDYRADRS